MAGTGPRVAVIGAGMAGLAAARDLRATGCPVVLFDKGRRPGGRAAHRQDRARADLCFDHGAQYFTARSDPFAAQVRDWEGRGVAARWEGRVVAWTPGGVEDKPAARFVGVPGMHALGADLARDLEVRSGVRVTRLRRLPGTGEWELHTADGPWPQRFPIVLVTTPPEQAVPLLDAAPALAARAAGVEMLPAWAVMVAWDARWEVPFDGAFLDGEPLSWIARDSSKPGRPPGDRWVLHGAPEWSRHHLDATPDEVVAQVLASLPGFGVGVPAVDHVAAHRWRFSQPREPLSERALFDDAIGLGLAGDWCGGPRVEGAWQSGRALARMVARA